MHGITDGMTAMRKEGRKEGRKEEEEGEAQGFVCTSTLQAMGLLRIVRVPVLQIC